MLENKYKATIQIGVDGEKTIGQLREEFKQLSRQLENTKQGTKEYDETLRRLASVRGEIKDLRESIAALDPERKAAAFGSFVNGVMGGFQAMTGAMELFGSESKEVQQTMLRLQAAANLAQGVQSVMELGKQFNILKTIILANPILTISTILTSIGIAVYELKDKFKIFGDIVDNVGKAFTFLKNKIIDVLDTFGLYDKKAAQIEDSYNKVKEAANGLTDAIDRQIKIMKSEGKDTYELEMKRNKMILENTEAQINALELLKKQRGSLNEDEKKQLDELLNKRADTIAAINTIEREHTEKIKEENQKRYEAYKLAQEKIKQERNEKMKEEEKMLIDSFSKQIEQINNYSQHAINQAKLIGEDTKRIELETLNAKLSIYQQELAALEERKNKGILINKEQYESIKNMIVQTQDEILLKEKEIEDEKILKINQSREIELQKELATLDNITNIRLIKAKEDEDAIFNIRLEALNKRLSLLDEYNAAEEEKERVRYQIQELMANREIELERKKQQAKAQMSQLTINALKSITDAYFAIEMSKAQNNTQKQREIAKKRFEVEKALNISQAIINTASAVTKALSSAPPPLNFALAGINAAMGAAQVAVISQQRFEENAVGSIATNNISTPSNFNENAVQPSTISNIQPLTPQGVQIDKDKEGNVKEGIVKAYVVEEEITSTQQKKELIQSMSGY